MLNRPISYASLLSFICACLCITFTLGACSSSPSTPSYDVADTFWLATKDCTFARPGEKFSLMEGGSYGGASESDFYTLNGIVWKQDGNTISVYFSGETVDRANGDPTVVERTTTKGQDVTVWLDGDKLEAHGWFGTYVVATKVDQFIPPTKLTKEAVQRFLTYIAQGENQRLRGQGLIDVTSPDPPNHGEYKATGITDNVSIDVRVTNYPIESGVEGGKYSGSGSATFTRDGATNPARWFLLHIVGTTNTNNITIFSLDESEIHYHNKFK